MKKIINQYVYQISIDNIRIAIITSQYNEKITNNLERSCIKTLIRNGMSDENIELYHVPGALEIPVTAKLIAKNKKPDAIIALGAVIKGDTYHFEVVVDNCSQGLQKVAMQYGIPVINEVLACYNMKQAKERAGKNPLNKGIEAAITALEMVEILNEI